MGTTPIPVRPPGEPPSAVQTSHPYASFQPTNIPPTQFAYLQQQDLLTILTNSNIASATLTMRYRYLTPQNEIKEGVQTFAVTSSPQNFNVPLGECWLLSFALNLSGGNPAGSWGFAQVGIGRYSNVASLIFPYGTLWQGYVPANTSVGWPGTPVKDLTDGGGFFRAITGTTPNPGQEITETVPNFRRWDLLVFNTKFFASATVATRTPDFLITDGLNTLWTVSAPATIAASGAAGYNLAPGSPNYTDLESFSNIPMPSAFSLKGGFQIRTSTLGLQAGDLWNPPHYLVREWGLWDA